MLAWGPEAFDHVEEAIGDVLGNFRLQVAGDLVLAVTFGALAGWWMTAVWLGAMLSIRIAHRCAGRIANKMQIARRSRAKLDLAFISLMYLMLGVITNVAAMRGGAWAAVAAVQVLAGMLLHASYVARKSVHAYVAFVGPTVLNLAALGACLMWSKAPLLPTISIIVNSTLTLAISVQMWRAAAAGAIAEATARREAEVATAAKSAFVAMVSHELRTPISGILAGSDEIKRAAVDPGVRSTAELIFDSGQMMRRLLDDLLDLSKIEAGRMSIERIDFDLRQLVRDTARFWAPEARRRGLRFRLEGARSLPRWVEGDPTRLRQILNNLFSNALKFTQAGSITLRMDAAARADGQIELAFEVADTGHGMSPDDLGRLFGAFDQLNASTARIHGGTGLGLNISRQLARLIGGELSATSVQGEGSVFRLALALGSGVSGDAPHDRVPVAEPGARVLVADDHAVNRQAFTLILRTVCDEIVCVENGEEALQALAVERFDVVLMDLNMPRMGGLEATRRLRAQDGPNRETPVIALTASVAPQEVDTCLAAGMNAFVLKPVSAHELLAAVGDALTARASADAVAA